MIYMIRILNIVVQLLTLLVILKVVFSYFMSPYQPVRIFIDRLVEPLLKPIRRIVPPIGMLDLSPIILIIVIQLIGRLIIQLLISIS